MKHRFINLKNTEFKKYILTIVSFLSSFYIVVSQSSKEYNLIGDSLLNKKKGNDLLAYFENEQKKFPKNEVVLKWIGIAQFELGKLEKSILNFNKALTINDTCYECLIRLTNIYYVQNEYSKAIEYVNKAITYHPEKGVNFAKRGLLKEAIGDKLGAFRDYENAVKLDPDNYAVYLYRANYNTNANLLSYVIKDYNIAIQLNPARPEAFFFRSKINAETGKWTEALNDVTKAIENNETAEYYTFRGELYLQLGQPQNAILDFTKSISLDSADYRAFVNRAQAFYSLELLDSACIDYTTVKRKIDAKEITNLELIDFVNGTINDICNENNPSYYYQRGIGCYNLQKFDEAINIYKIGLSKFEKNGMILNFLGNAYMAKKEFNKAIESYGASEINQLDILKELAKNPRFKGKDSTELKMMFSSFLSTNYSSLSQCYLSIKDYQNAAKYNLLAKSSYVFNPEISESSHFYIEALIALNRNKLAEAKVAIDKAYLLEKEDAVFKTTQILIKASMINGMQIDQSQFVIENNILFQILSWKPLNKKQLKQNKTSILELIQELNLVIDKNSAYGLSFYIRGHLKQLIGFNSFCDDFLKAKELDCPFPKGTYEKCFN